MVKGVNNKTALPYVLEEDRMNPEVEQTVFYVRPKTGHDNNQTLQRYAAAMKEGRRGGREINVSKLTLADQEEFCTIVEKVTNYCFPDEHPKANAGKPWPELTDMGDLKEVASTLSADQLSEVLEVANSITKLKEGARKKSNS